MNEYFQNVYILLNECIFRPEPILKFAKHCFYHLDSHTLSFGYACIVKGLSSQHKTVTEFQYSKNMYIILLIRDTFSYRPVNSNFIGLNFTHSSMALMATPVKFTTDYLIHCSAAESIILCK